MREISEMTEINPDTTRQATILFLILTPKLRVVALEWLQQPGLPPFIPVEVQAFP
jgi:hypothetical protein